MLSKIAAFELRYHLRSPLFFIGFAIFFLLTFGATVSDRIQIGDTGNINVNSPAAILQVMGIMNAFGLFVIAGEHQVTLTLEQLPRFVGVDPYNKRIDRNSDDNLMPVVLQ